jgi:hypothetical protein
MFIGAYDQVTDEGIQKVQTDVTTLFIKMEKKVDEGSYTTNTYDSLRNDFTAIEGEIKSLQIRCGALPKYKIIEGQLVTIYDNITLVEQLSKTPIRNKRVFVVADSTMEIQFKSIATLQNALKTQKNK